ncbi:phosphatidate cytidylyltransferase [Candidatus Pelagibacter communis]|uniref:phosphatidate cytidylyltransferase n=1 Tax=Pelagibacter ubique TaxID=198252 RepID=UPI00065B4421|nr:phosphatidate cytidylyltransferase [Candidatus Pelagibacter ubique]
MSNLTKRILSSFFLLPLIFIVINVGSYLLILFTIICFFISCYEWNLIAKDKIYKFFGYIYFILCFYLFYQTSIDKEKIFFVILVCASTDIGGYVFGNIFKGPKLTKISPNKTYAGMFGGYLISILLIFLLKDFFLQLNIFNANLIFSTVLLSTASQIGDIFVSFFKRKSNIKNSGNLIPGHGGILDRIDGILFALPTFYLLNLINF